MFVGVVLTCFLGMIYRVNVMPLGDMRMMAGAFMIPALVMFGGRSMVAGGMVVMLRGFTMVLSALIGHKNLR